MITLRPVGGLCNRLLAIDSMIRVCESIKKDLKIIWLINEDLGSAFHLLYQPIRHQEISIELIEFDSRPFFYSDRLLNNPRQKLYNRFLKAWQSFSFDHILHASETARLKSEGYDFTLLDQYSNTYISSWCRFDDKPFRPQLFQPVGQIQKQIPIIKPNTIGVHIRRADHTLAIQQSPLEMFVEAMDAELDNNKDVNFFVASDSAEIKSKLIELYGDKIMLNSPSNADRDSSDGMLDAMKDLYGLANTQKIIGSSISTFTVVASEINGIELIDLTK